MKLILPSIKYKNSFLDALEEFHAEGKELFYNPTEIDADFDAGIEKANERMSGVPKEQRVPDTLFWLVDNGEFIGRVSLRHTLNERLKEYGGHVGYYIRPSEQGKGYGTQALRLAIEEAKKLGLKKILVTCDEDNIGSRKVIEKNGGVLQDVIKTPLNDNRPLMRWWIDL